VNWNKSVNETAIRAEEQVKTLDAKQRDLEGKIKTLDDRLSQIPASAKPQQSR
jgi:prefoldin subunit 5